MNLMARLESWRRWMFPSATPRVRRHYPRGTCARCGVTNPALTSKGPWPHHCDPNRTLVSTKESNPS
jgi:hypothetical protein